MAVKRFNDVAEKLIIKALKNDENQLIAYKLSRSWSSIVGDQISVMVKVKEVAKGCLILKLTNHCYGVEINMYKKLIIDRINTFLGGEIFVKVVIV